jgi:4'-phosphopantetheinyl transferase EntD
MAMIQIRCALGFLGQELYATKSATSKSRQLLTAHLITRTTTRPRSYSSASKNVRRLNSISSDAINESPTQLHDDKGNDGLFFDRLCDLELSEGRCVGLTLREFAAQDPNALTPEAIAKNSSHWIHSRLDPQEIAFGIALPSEVRRETFFIGRLAVREALGLPLFTAPATTTLDENSKAGIPAILKDEHGRPLMPKGFLGSISHKEKSGVGLVARDYTSPSHTGPPKLGIGIDLERTSSNRRSVAKKILTASEIKALGSIPGVSADEEVLLRFRYVHLLLKTITLRKPGTQHNIYGNESHRNNRHSHNTTQHNTTSLKESIYKAVHPLLNQYIGFQEAEVTPSEDGTASVVWNLKTGAHERLAKVTAKWRKLPCGGYFLSSAEAHLKDEVADDV